jgi:signal-transduction protein with cAMP-binding, CBS, and nucleotidyltransferase domain
VQQVADMMIKKRIHRVFVTREGKVVGIISTPDILKIIRDM